VRKLLLLVPIVVLVPLLFAGDRPLTTMTPTAATSGSAPDLPVLRHRDFGEVGSPATPATPTTPNPTVANPATPATPALPPGATLTTTNPNDDPCDGFNNIDARERCREDQQQRNERDFERSHNTPTPFPTN
jgi:hypothetical protein